MCVKSPREIEVANCIKAKYDAGISNLQADGSGVVKKAGTEFERVTDVASCLMARDYKGLGNYIGNGVIEIENLTGL